MIFDVDVAEVKEIYYVFFSLFILWNSLALGYFAYSLCEFYFIYVVDLVICFNVENENMQYFWKMLNIFSIENWITIFFDFLRTASAIKIIDNNKSWTLNNFLMNSIFRVNIANYNLISLIYFHAFTCFFEHDKIKNPSTATTSKKKYHKSYPEE